MSFFVNLYESASSSQFLKVIQDPQSGGFYALGVRGENGLVTRLDHRGFIIWEKVYRAGSGTILFRSGVTCANGDLLLYGSQPTGRNRSRHLLVRIDGLGHLLWSRVIDSGQSRAQIQLAALPTGGYVFAGWQNPVGSTDNIELARVDEDGRLLQTALLGSNGDDQLNHLVPYGEGFLLVGETSSGPGWDGFVAYVTASFKPQWLKRIGNRGFETVNDLLPLDDGRFLIVGSSGQAKSHLTIFDPAVSTALGQVLDIFPAGSDRGRHRLVQAGGRTYLTAHAYRGGDGTAVVALNSAFQPMWSKKLKLDNHHFVSEMMGSTQEQALWLCGRKKTPNETYVALLAKTDLNLHSCVTQNLETPAIQETAFQVGDVPFKLRDHQMTAQRLPLKVEEGHAKRTVLCPQKMPIDLGASYLLQSPYLYLQAAGSDETDGSVRGVHLRWELMGELGEQHLPKGNLTVTHPAYQTQQGFNKPNDFVRIYRAFYEGGADMVLDLRNPPTHHVDAGAAPQWLYSKLRPGSLGYVRFPDKDAYALARAGFDPKGQPADFIANYHGMLEIGVRKKMLFELSLKGFRATGPHPVVALELISIDPNGERTISCRKRFTGFTQLSETLRCENIVSMRLQLEDVTPGFIEMTSYEDFLLRHNEGRGHWDFLGEFALSDHQDEVFKRLENASGAQVDKAWPKFNEGDPVSGACKVNLANYKDRWSPASAPSEGLHGGVVNYLKLSTTDPKAAKALPSKTPKDAAHLDISYLDMLRLVAVDYHVACMLGLGHKDEGEVQHEQWRFVYVAEYKTQQTIPGAKTKGPLTHLYMSLPTSQLDHRLPPAPELEPASYGLFVDNGTINPTELTSPGGYDRHADIRYVRLTKKPFAYEQDLRPFFADPTLFCAGDETQPVLFGIEYREDSESRYRKPEIAVDSEYRDHAGLEEVTPIPENGATDQPIFIHRETEPGIHHYALYSINWFSRASRPGNEVTTDMTEYPVRNTLIPPHNLAVQLVQKEVPRILTTEKEQQALVDLDADKALIRINFDWNQVHNIAWQFADRVEFFFREEEALEVRGKVTGISDISDFEVQVKTGPYRLESLDPVQTITPAITLLQKDRFIGSVFSAGDREYIVEEVNCDDAYPVFTLRKLLETETSEVLLNNEFLTEETYHAPALDEHFLVRENLTRAENWSHPLAMSTGIDVLNRHHRETDTTMEGDPIEKPVAGWYEQADVTPDSGGLAGVYTINFGPKSLPAPPTGATWHKGSVRIETVDESHVKTLQVWDVDTDNTDLVLTVYDASFSATPKENIQTGKVHVNFHPGYQLYVASELTGPFQKQHILPNVGQGTKMTFMAARSLDTTTGLASPLCPPVPLIAQEVLEPQKPEAPVGPQFATSPDYYGKSTYTFDVGLTHQHVYALVFYRAEARIILDTLYKPETIYDPEHQTGILVDLDAAAAGDEGLMTQYWQGLVNVQLDAANRFKKYDNDFRFPMPDNPNYILPNMDPEIEDRPFANQPADLSEVFTVRVENVAETETGPPIWKTESRSYEKIVQQAIQDAFTALTEQPVIYGHLKSGQETSSKQPLVRDQAGNRLDQSKTDPFPMAVRLADGSVRFTDYTLSGASTGLFFYYAVEMNNKLITGEASGILGPIQLIDRSPPEAPALKKAVTKLAEPAQNQPAKVQFRINSYIPSDRVSAIEIYRTTDAAASLSPRSMTLVKLLNLGEELEDDFTDLAFPPYEETLYYKLVAIRRIKDEDNQLASVRSKPSKTITARIVDNTNPPAPTLTYSQEPSGLGTQPSTVDVVLRWEPTCHNGTYYLYKMTSEGQWHLIYQIKTNEPMIQYPPQTGSGPDYKNFPATKNLPKENNQNEPMYHRFKVRVENASGLMELENQPLTI